MIDTKGFQSLLALVDNTANDSFELYYGLFMYNQVRVTNRSCRQWKACCLGLAVSGRHVAFLWQGPLVTFSHPLYCVF